ncbi:MAG: histidinol phosphate phosphatase domain-containing protein [Candidatus Omnitrophica bacterium]|nr:histidinol phosphate phosphatase domain-containing protein [Candidatus Omnitrophota bacterium]MBU1127642.1 histidinol phosphate phosphatase domain-containing protein [Candidatus Omnitrophota bacterium]MBU1656641.1 histidinol phosphate phosphatase domain-containing protein [Candidatus Omnitrophota bacterium]MBU1783761.1 histidinol phosphate phosphatase domain-containing protein [Candidatus Omnitrophota bacterium]MBU1851534.1 histidinol phosphate phosphatase domain-containing protein [Candidat
MIDLHTHTILSDGVLIPSELVRRAEVNGIEAIALTDHVDYSNIEFVIAGLLRVTRVLNQYGKIYVIPGVEITHVPIEAMGELITMAREKGSRIVVVHGESPVEPVIVGTNRAAIKAGADILAHPGRITEEDARLAAEKGVYLEITCRRGHSGTNAHVFGIAQKTGAKLVLNTDAHLPEDILTKEMRDAVLGELTDSEETRSAIIRNSEEIVAEIKAKYGRH